MALSYVELRDGVAGTAVGVRCRTELQPLGGAGDKVFPPTYAPDGDAKTKYAEVPGAAGRAARLKDGVAPLRVILLQVIGDTDPGNTRTDDEHVNGLSLPGGRVHEPSLHSNGRFQSSPPRCHRGNPTAASNMYRDCG